MYFLVLPGTKFLLYLYKTPVRILLTSILHSLRKYPCDDHENVYEKNHISKPVIMLNLATLKKDVYDYVKSSSRPSRVQNLISYTACTPFARETLQH